MPLNEFVFPADRVKNVQSQVCDSLCPGQFLSKVIADGNTYSHQLEKLLQNNYYLHQSARNGYRSYLQAYAAYSFKKIFDLNKLDLVKTGKAFGFAIPPNVNINVRERLAEKKRKFDFDDEEVEEGSRKVRPRISERNRGKTMKQYDRGLSVKEINRTKT